MITVYDPDPSTVNNELSCYNAMYVGSSGSGKTTAVKKMNIAAQDSAVFFDPYGDYQGSFQGQTVFTYYDWPEFAENLFKARLSGKPFKIAKGFKGRVSKADFELFCGLAWACGNGYTMPLNIVLEELAQFSDTAGKMDGRAGDLLRVGRKYGLRTHCVFQRGQEVGKTLIANAPVKWIGYCERENDARYLAGELGIDVEAIKTLNKLDYLLRNESHGRGEFEKGCFKFKKV